MGSLKIEVDG